MLPSSSSFRLFLRNHHLLRNRSLSSLSPASQYRLMSASIERAAEVSANLLDIKSQVSQYSLDSNHHATLVAVSKYKPASDILTCYEDGQLDFGENYVQELVEKAEGLPSKIRWHFIGTLQSNKAKTLAAIPNLHTIQTLTSSKTAKALDKALPSTRTTPLNILIQVNTSGEDAKSGLPPLSSSSDTTTNSNTTSELFEVAKTIVTECPRLRLQGLMTIGSLEQSLDAKESLENLDFERLKETRDVLQGLLEKEVEVGGETKNWGEEGRLLVSMGMSSDFVAALKSGSNIVRVGTGIFGSRAKK